MPANEAASKDCITCHALHYDGRRGACSDDCIDDTKPSVIVIDPPAGHGPGIGGFKRDSEIGIALHEGQPVYFVSFFSAPSN
ncbi:DUF3141 domain-containing protein [Bradyrhizobium sp. G127]|uniref:DUF3141 domain-containing protein n=1 Tax=Bradyrhizobium sp. G127 TaxID=2904800 RepID=UPI0032DE4B1B